AVEPSGAKSFVFERRGEVHFESSEGFPRASYLFAISSNWALPPLPMSVLIDPIEPAQREQVLKRIQQQLVASEEGRSALEAPVSSLPPQVALLEADRAGLSKARAEVDRRAKDLNGRLVTATRARTEADRRVKDLNVQLAAATKAQAEA